MQRRRRVGHLFHGDVDGRVAGERQVAAEHLVQHDPHRVDVRLGADRQAAGLLRREVLGGADDRPHLGHLLGVGRPGDAEVGHLEPALVGQDHVVRLDVAVHHPLAVGGVERGQRLGGVVDRLGLGQRGAAGDLLLERRPVQVLHRDVRRAHGLAAVVDRDDVGMPQAGGRGRLTPEPLDEARVAGVAVGQDLDRHLAPERLVGGEVHVGHAARSELALDQVAAVEELADEGEGAHEAATLPRLSPGTPRSPWPRWAPRPVRRRAGCAPRPPRRRSWGGRRGQTR